MPLRVRPCPVGDAQGTGDARSDAGIPTTATLTSLTARLIPEDPPNPP